MKQIFVLCLVTFTLTTNPGLSGQAVPPMQTGITVNMPATNNAAVVPDADEKRALIVTLTGDGKVYVGTSLIDPEVLSSELTSRLSAGRPLYIKADARAPYATVIKVLDASTAAGFEKTVLLTNQNGSPHPGTVSPPKGFAVVTGECSMARRPRHLL